MAHTVNVFTSQIMYMQVSATPHIVISVIVMFSPGMDNLSFFYHQCCQRFVNFIIFFMGASRVHDFFGFNCLVLILSNSFLLFFFFFVTNLFYFFNYVNGGCCAHKSSCL